MADGLYVSYFTEYSGEIFSDIDLICNNQPYSTRGWLRGEALGLLFEFIPIILLEER